MPIAQIMFHKLIQDSQDYGSNDEHMVSRVFFDMKIEDKVYTDYANIKQPIGSNYEATPLEISKPINYNGPFNYQAFRDITEKYYRHLVGMSGCGIRITGCTNVRMRNNTFVQHTSAQFPISRENPAW
jgi:hypothetical protein